MKRKILLTLALVIGFWSMKAQQGVKSLMGAEVGILNTVFYEQALSTRWIVKAHIGAVLNAGYVFNGSNKGFYYDGLTPSMGLQGRWYHSAVKYSGTNNNGGFLALGINYLWNKYTFLTNTPLSEYHMGTISLTPGWGYNRDLTDRLGIKFFSGFSINWNVQKYVAYEVECQRSSLPLVIDLGLTYRL
ncbi:MAG: hypothetical protein Q4A64_02260 [Porphyromonadaceae bacterium]|nr:hypothetical protein [Porphyromonadaceae bacterium]